MRISTTSLYALSSALAMGIAAAPLHAAVISVVPTDENGALQDPDGLVYNQLRAGTVPKKNNGERDVKEGRNNAQTFTLGQAVTIDKIAINFQESPVGSQAVKFEFFSVATADGNPLTPVSIIDSVDFEGSDLGGAAGTLVFDVADTVAAAGSSFGIRFTTSSATSLAFKWMFATNEYDGGTRYEKGNLQADDDYTIGVIAVPEPASMALAAVAGCPLLLRRRRAVR